MITTGYLIIEQYVYMDRNTTDKTIIPYYFKLHVSNKGKKEDAFFIKRKNQ